MASKAAYVRPIQDLSLVAGRVSEQVCGRKVHHFTETLKKGLQQDCGGHRGWPVPEVGAGVGKLGLWRTKRT